MKNKTKALCLAMAAVLLVTATIFGTMAYLTDDVELVNTFTVGSVEITLDEADVKPDGTYETDHGNRVADNDYKLIPGREYMKDPTVTVSKGSEESYVRMLVTINNAQALKEVFGENSQSLNQSLNNCIKGWNANEWRFQGMTEDAAANTVTYEFRYKETVKALTSEVVLDDLFESFTVPATMTKEQLAKLKDTKVTVVAHAIQADGFDDAEAAWNAFSTK